MEVEAALQLFRHSLSQNDLHYTSVICDSYSRVYQTLCEEKPHRFMSILKEDCVNHMKKRMGTAFRTFVNKTKKGEPLWKRGAYPRADKKFTYYYGLALRNNTEGNKGHLL